MAGLAGILLLCLPLAGRADDALFQDLGGREKISAFTTDLVGRIRQDQRIAHFFDETDFPRFHDRLTDMFCHLAGEQRRYRGANMYRAHEGLGITDAAFNAVVEDLEEAMDDAGVPWGTQARFLAVLAPLKSQIVAP
jgi:hemoglobin